MHYLQKELYEKVKENSEIFDFIQEAALDGLWYWDLESPEHEWMNPKFWKVLGYTPEEMPHKAEAWQDIIHPEDKKLALENAQKHFANPKHPYDQEVRYKHKKGHTVWIRCKGLAIRNKEGKPLRMLGAHTDITESKENEIKARDELNFLKAIYGNQSIFVVKIDLEGKFTFVNDYYAQIFGKTIESFVGEDSRLGMLKNDLPKLEDIIKKCIEKPQKKVKTELSKEIQQKYSTALWEFIGLTDSKENTIEILGIGYDITERVVIEKKLKRTTLLLNDAQRIAKMGAWELDLSTGQTFWTDALKEIYEVSQDFVADPKLIFSFYTKESEKELKEAIELCIAKGKDYRLDLEIITAKGNKIWVRAIGNAAFENGELVKLYGTLQDITQVKNDEAKLIEARETAIKANRAKSEFLANMSHEIRTPLSSIIGFSELLIQTEMDDNQSQYMSAINQSGTGLLALINDILDFSKIESGKMEINTEKVDIYKLCEQIIEIIRLKVNSEKLELLLKISPEIPQFIWIDALRLRQVLINLLSNAIKFTEKGEVELAISKKKLGEIKEDKNLTTFEFSVRDTGIGILQEKQAQIFDAFAQADASTTREYGGTGLGITISNKLLMLMKSHLQLESEKGKGSRFYFDLAVKTTEEQKLNWQSTLNLKHVLIVDDNINNCSILQEMLDSQSITSDIAEDGMVALKILDRDAKSYDALIIDYDMPFMSGYEVIKQIREKLHITAQQLPILLLHSSESLGYSEESYQSKLFYIKRRKPLHYYQLFEALKGLGKKSKYYQDKEEQEVKVEINNTKKFTILITDDNPLNRLLTTDMVKTVLSEVKVLEAKNGEEAVGLFKKEKLDLILMDIQMPFMSGYEATQKIRALEKEQNKKATAIIALTAGTVKGEKERCLAVGMNAYLSKPIDMQRIKNAFVRWLPKKIAPELQSSEILQGESQNYLHFNKEKLLKKIHYDMQVFENLLNVIEEGLLINYLQSIREAIQNKDKQKIKTVAHAIKGSALGVCFEILADLARALENLKPFEFSEAQKIEEKIANEINFLMNIVKEEL